MLLKKINEFIPKPKTPTRDLFIAAKPYKTDVLLVVNIKSTNGPIHVQFVQSSVWRRSGEQNQNPFDLSLNPCTSSSGSPVEVMANFCVVAICK